MGRADENATDIFVMWEIKAASSILIFNSSSATPSVWSHSLVIVKKRGGATKHVLLLLVSRKEILKIVDLLRCVQTWDSAQDIVCRMRAHDGTANKA